MDYNSAQSGDRDAVKSDGTVVPHTTAVGCTLGAATYYFPIGTQLAPTPAQTVDVLVHLAWAAAVAATFTVEVSNFPATRGGVFPGGGSVPGGSDDVKDYDATAGNWIQWNPTLTGSVYANVVGASNTITAYTMVAGGAAAGGGIFNITDLGCRRVRIKAVVTNGGNVRCNVHGKLGA